MAKKIAVSLSLLIVAIMSPYFYYRHFPLSWKEAQAAFSGTAAAPDANSLTLPTINKPGHGKIWVCPMHPEIMQDHPGTCPICGMPLVLAKGSVHEHGVQVDSATVQMLGVRLASVKKTTVSREVRAYGNVTEDGGAVYNIHSKFNGLIKKTYINSIGQQIEKGQVIYEIYSPELIAQQNEFIHFIERRDQILQSVGDARFQENEFVMNLLQDFSRERTRFLHEDVSLDTVQKIEDSRMIIEVVKIVAAESGVVTQIKAREGSNVLPATMLFSLANVDKVWVDISLYPDQARQVKIGDEVAIMSSDGQKARSRIGFISPIAEGNQASARVEIDNRKLHLRPGSFVDVLILAQPHEALVLPRSAVMYSGTGNSVMLSRGNGHFLPVHVETGIENGDSVEIVDGLRKGAEVAVNGQFLLDAASFMNAAAERMHSGHHD